MSIPKDGHYTAEIQYDTGGTLPTYVHVHNGIIRSIVGNEIKPDACSDFHPVSTQQFCGLWPWEASIELEALRTANAGLVEKVKRLGDAGDMVASHCDNQLALHEWITAKGQP